MSAWRAFDWQLVHAGPQSPALHMALDEVLTRLESLSERQARVVECRFFAGMNIEETAEALDCGGD